MKIEKDQIVQTMLGARMVQAVVSFVGDDFAILIVKKGMEVRRPLSDVFALSIGHVVVSDDARVFARG